MMSCYFNIQYWITYLTSSCWSQQDFRELFQGRSAPHTVRNREELNVCYWVEAVGVSVNGHKYTLHSKPQFPERTIAAPWASCAGLRLREKAPSPASLSGVYLISKPSIKQSCCGSEDRFPHEEWEAQEQALGRCSKGSAIKEQKDTVIHLMFCSVPFPPCRVNKCAFCYDELMVFWLWLSSINKLTSPPMPL